ncbi:MAG: ABC transporter permease, partial [Acidobacteriota bacterium]
MSQHDFAIWTDQHTVFEGIAGFHTGTLNLADGENLPERYSGAWISANFLELLGEQPALGRGFRPEDAEVGAEPVVLISHRVWQQRYGGDPGVIGRHVRLSSEPATVVGVLPEGFRFPETEDLWAPLSAEGALAVPRGSDELPSLTVFGRLKADTSLEEAASQMAVIGHRLEQQFPETHAGRGVRVEPYNDRYADEESLQLLGVMFAAVVLVLVVACFNVANLMIGRTALRGRDFAIQAALGSPRLHSMAQVLTESLLLAVPGAFLGLGFAHVAVGVFDRAVSSMGVPFWLNFHLSPTIFLVTAGFTLLAALISGLAPAIQASRSEMPQTLSDGSRGTTSFRMGRLSRALVITQVAASTALCLGSGIAVRGVLSAQSFEHAFETENLLSARVGLPSADYASDDEQIAFFEALERRLEAEAGLEAVAISTVLPAENAIGSGRLHYERPGEVYERPSQMPRARVVAATPGYFQTLGASLVAGRDFTAADRADAPAVAIVNESFARQEWPGHDAVGQDLDLWLGAEAEAADGRAGTVRVVGVAPDLRFGGFGKANDQRGIYLPLAQQPAAFAWIVARTRDSPTAFSQPLRRAV